MTVEDYKVRQDIKESQRIDEASSYIHDFKESLSVFSKKAPKNLRHGDHFESTPFVFGQILMKKSVETLVKENIKRGVSDRMHSIRRRNCEKYNEPNPSSTDDSEIDNTRNGIPNNVFRAQIVEETKAINKVSEDFV